jgi:hypothetical protein
MSSTRGPMATVDQAFREHALVLGGLAAMGRISDEAVWQLAHSLRASRMRVLRLLDPSGGLHDGSEVDSRPHPAIAQFLRSLGSG